MKLANWHPYGKAQTKLENLIQNAEGTTPLDDLFYDFQNILEQLADSAVDEISSLEYDLEKEKDEVRDLEDQVKDLKDDIQNLQERD